MKMEHSTLALLARFPRTPLHCSEAGCPGPRMVLMAGAEQMSGLPPQFVSCQSMSVPLLKKRRTREFRAPGCRLAHHTAAHAALIGACDEHARAHAGLGHACHALDRPAHAHHHYRRALTLYTDLGWPQADQVRAHLTALGQAIS
jgi:hypothetical protein